MELDEIEMTKDLALEGGSWEKKEKDDSIYPLNNDLLKMPAKGIRKNKNSVDVLKDKKAHDKFLESQFQRLPLNRDAA